MNSPRLSWKDIDKEDKSKTIEHILPQTPTDPYWKEHWKPSEMEVAMHDLGNLVLTYDNSSYSNHSFPIKKGDLQSTKRCYATSHLASERKLCIYNNWNYENYEDRREKLEIFILNRWNIDFSGVTVTDDIDEDEDEE